MDLIITRSGGCLASSAQSTTCGKVTLAGLRGPPLGRGVEGVPASYTTALFLIAAPSSLPQAAFPFFSISATAVRRASHHTALGPVQMQSAVLPVSSHQALPAMPPVCSGKGGEKKEETYIILGLRVGKHTAEGQRARTVSASEKEPC